MSNRNNRNRIRTSPIVSKDREALKNYKRQLDREKRQREKERKQAIDMARRAKEQEQAFFRNTLMPLAMVAFLVFLLAGWSVLGVAAAAAVSYSFYKA